MTSKEVPIAGPWITEKEIQAVTESARIGWYKGATQFQQQFEEAFASYIGRKFALATSSCTSAIHLALAASNIGPGDEVIIPESTWIGTVAPVKYLGATPVFVDIDERTWCMSAAEVQKAITPATKAILTVDLYGNMCDYDAIENVIKDSKISLIEDSAQAIGAEYKARRSGNFGRASVFSFHGTKTLTTGEGGMLVSDDEEFIARAKFLGDHARAKDRDFWHPEIGYKYKMTSMQAALGTAQLSRINELLQRKREIFDWYHKRLANHPSISLNTPGENVKATYWMTTVAFAAAKNIDIDNLRANLKSQGIATRPFFYPLSSMPALKGAKLAEDNSVAISLAKRAFNLPSAMSLTEADVDFVCSALLKSL